MIMQSVPRYSKALICATTSNFSFGDFSQLM